MEYKIKSKPTIYNGTKYRSRLEARWAAFFDLIGWRYQYEPYDFDGYTPDYVIYGTNNRLLFIEIKPIVNREYAIEYSKKLNNINNKINVVMLSTEFKEDTSSGGVIAGYQIRSTDHYYYDINGNYDEIFPVHWKDCQSGINTEYDIGSSEMVFDGMLFYSDNRKCFLSRNYKSGFDKFINFWIEAGELTRFHYE